MLSLLLQETFDADGRTWASSVRSAGGFVTSAQIRRVSRLIKGLKSDGVWSSLDRLWLFASENSTQARRDLVARAVANPANGPTFTANRGYTGDALSADVDTNFNPATAGGKYTQDNASYGAWVYNDPGVPSTMALMGNDNDNLGVMLFGSGGNIVAGVNQAAGAINVTPAARTELLAVERTASSAIQAYRKGVSIGTAVGVSTAMVSRTFLVLAGNAASPPSQPINSGVSAAFIGASLGVTLQLALYNRLRTYMTAVGVP